MVEMARRPGSVARRALAGIGGKKRREGKGREEKGGRAG